MTLIAAIGCTDGVVIAADSASSDADSGTKQPVDKLCRIGTLPIIFGGAGNVGLIQQIQEAVGSFAAKPNLKRTRQDLKALVVPEQKAALAGHVPYPQQPFNMPPSATMLFVGVLGEKSWILEIEKNGEDTIYGEDMGNFAAIGSGKPWAQAVFRPHLNTARDLKLGKLLACRVLDDAIALAAFGLAKPIRIRTVSSGGEVVEVSQDEVDELEQQCELWRELERETLGRFLAPGEAEAPVAVPLP